MPPLERPNTNNADLWAAWLDENKDVGVSFLAVQIAAAFDEISERSNQLDRAQVVRMISTDQEHAVCVGGK